MPLVCTTKRIAAAALHPSQVHAFAMSAGQNRLARVLPNHARVVGITAMYVSLAEDYLPSIPIAWSIVLRVGFFFSYTFIVCHVLDLFCIDLHLDSALVTLFARWIRAVLGSYTMAQLVAEPCRARRYRTTCA